MDTPRYILLKCVEEGCDESDEFTHKLTLSGLESVVQADSLLNWGDDPRRSISVKNSDGSVAVLKAYRGFSFTSTPGMSDFFICYEFNDGVCIHTERQNGVWQKCAEFAEALGAKAFPIY